MEPTATRRRAPGMSPEQRREAVVRAALPLVAEFGTAVTTAQVARAAGIGEATIFRVFPDKDALLDACVAEALDPTNLLGQLRSIPLDQSLATRLVDAADALRAHLDRMGAVLGVLSATGHRRRLPDARDARSASDAASARGAASAATADKAAAANAATATKAAASAATADKAAGADGSDGAGNVDRAGRGAGTGRSAGRDAATAAVHEAVAELFEPDFAALRGPVDALTEAFLGLMFGHGRMPGAGPTLSTEKVVDLFLHGALDTDRGQR
ncbi:TetR/AcrR family transcriptional regulator [Rugosimonospora africana]|uniref:HTH tetR-type domain-containing protein n=1 Tax=Rugosimonospora africana TaxID=556532 RepID=A0A8J3R6F4_9ACTN|nr:TetR family transcriptional regulator [Rugosimonospora africana]GIH20886.1 hypothetical protein Raf01_90580 [Rugosimonospora africana]